MLEITKFVDLKNNKKIYSDYKIFLDNIKIESKTTVVGYVRIINADVIIKDVNMLYEFRYSIKMEREYIMRKMNNGDVIYGYGITIASASIKDVDVGLLGAFLPIMKEIDRKKEQIFSFILSNEILKDNKGD